MSQKVIISSDSTCDLSRELIEKYDVKISPMVIVKENESLLDGVNVSQQDIFEYQKKTGKLMKSAAFNLAESIEYIKSVQEEGSAVIHFSISSEMSSTYSNSCLAAEEFKDVYAIDSRNLSTGIGLMVLRACELRDKGLSAKEIFDEIEQAKKRVDASFVVDTLEYLYKGGRCSGVAALGANLLRLKPCIEVKNGKMDVGKKYRGKLPDVLKSYVLERLADGDDIELDRAFVTHTVDPEQQELVDEIKQLVAQTLPFKEVIETRAGCTVSVHCGPNTLGVLFVRKSIVE